MSIENSFTITEYDNTLNKTIDVIPKTNRLFRIKKKKNDIFQHNINI